MKERYHLVVIGFDEIVSNKYLICIKKALSKKVIDGYTIIDLKDEEENIKKRVESLYLKPEKIYYLQKSKDKNNWASKKDFEPVLKKIQIEKKNIKVYIATELKAHEGYLKYCVENGIPCLVEKPVIAPLKDGIYYPEKIDKEMKYYIKKIREHGTKSSVMTLGRYHKIYNDLVMRGIKERMIKYQAPLTSFHLRHAGGVWNLHSEYISREDHPYKYGYGMMMHGAYHYVDIAVQFICLNKLLYPNENFEISISSYGAYPQEQNDRISKKYSEKFEDNCSNWEKKEGKGLVLGETDITSTFCFRNKKTKKVITLGTISLEQTTPSVRSWKDFPQGIYNKNGRISSVDIEAQLSTLYSTNIKCFDVPIRGKKEVERIDAMAQVLTRANATLLKDEEYITKKTYKGLFHSDSNKALMLNWLLDKEDRSTLEQHLLVMRMIQAMSISLKKQGYPVVIDF